MRTILIIGIGVGDPDFVTVQAIKALNRADVFFIPDKGDEKAALRHLRETICRRFVERGDYATVSVPIPLRAAEPDYRGSVDDWHARLADAYEARFVADLAEGQCGGLLVWGDPTLYDSTIRIVEAIRARGLALDYEVIPGIGAVQALAARHRIPLNRIGRPVLITTGRELADGMPKEGDSVVVMLDGEQAFTRIEANGIDIYWGAYLGSEDEILISGPVSEVGAEIERVRRQARERNGWIMDTYLLRRRES